MPATGLSGSSPWFLWKLLIDLRRQRKGYGQAVVRHIVEMVRAQGATELLTSNASGEGRSGRLLPPARLIP